VRPPEEKVLGRLQGALVHDWLTGMRGGEKVLESFCRILPGAPIYTLVHLPGQVSPLIESHPIHASGFNRLPGVAGYYRHLLPFYPGAADRFRLPPVRLVLSSSHCVAKGVRPPAGAVHVSYVHTPMRYVWDLYDAYFGPGRGGAGRWLMPLVRGYLQRWDVRTAGRVHHFVANSRHVARRILRHYRRRATVIHPPVDTGRFAPADQVGDYYLVVSALVPYKRVDLAVEACTHTGRRLKVVGKGPELERLRTLAGPTVEFLGWQPDEALPELYARARALIFPGEEDFGITPLESMASGRPVAAFARGGALETVVGPEDPQGRPQTGEFFREPLAGDLAAALDRLERRREELDPRALVEHAAGFDTRVFERRMCAFLEEALAQPGGS
jgi:glycosyltransferase involved in cell wall biosynthesis